MIFLQNVKAASHLSSSDFESASPLGNNSFMCGSRPTQRCESTSATRASSFAKKDFGFDILLVDSDSDCDVSISPALGETKKPTEP